jgi:histidine triad (HIT) family protein
MQEPTIFTRIIRGEIPCYKIYEDDQTLAFLDIHPAVPGHTLVIPKVEVDKIYDLTDEDYQALMTTVKKVMQRQIEVFGPEYRSCLKVIGFDVPHVHVHVVPCKVSSDFHIVEGDPVHGDEAVMAEIAKKLAF